MTDIIKQLLESPLRPVRYKVATEVLTADPELPEMRYLRDSIRKSPLVKTLLSEQDEHGRIPHHSYHKWDGAHWVLNMLADLSYPPGDETLRPLAEQVYEWLFSGEHTGKIKRLTFEGRTRMCASMEGNAIYYLLALGLADERVEALAERLLNWQWPDGGWNCDKHAHAQHNSSFTETLIPLRGLAAYARHSGDSRVKAVVEQAAEVFLNRRLFKRLHGGQIIEQSFVELHYPCFWHYDILFALKVMHEAGFLHDERCTDALDLLQSKRLPDGGFPAEKKYYRVTGKQTNGRSVVDWGGTSTRHMNPFVTVEALTVLKAAGRLT